MILASARRFGPQMPKSSDGASLDIIFTQPDHSATGRGTLDPSVLMPPTVKGPARIETEDFVFEDKRTFEQSRPQEPSEKPLKEPLETLSNENSAGTYQQASLFENTDYTDHSEPKIMLKDNRPSFRIIGQVFETYWMIQYERKLLIIDQHAAHEKVNYERLMKRLSDNDPASSGSQILAPASVITLTGREEGAYHTHADVFRSMGYEIEPLGGSSYAIRAVPMELYGNDATQLLRDTLEEIVEEKLGGTPRAILSKIASMSCKATVKGGAVLSLKEAEALIEELLGLDNPYHCPHGRPTMIVFSQSDMDKKFKRIVT